MILPFCYNILTTMDIRTKSQGIESKSFEFSIDYMNFKYPIIQFPSRPKNWLKNSKNTKLQKFPKKHLLHINEKKAQALHFFANHELLAMEMFAWAILYYPNINNATYQQKLLWFQTLLEEQSHFNLYVNRIQELGFKFGDFPINTFFWNKLSDCPTIESFICLINLTFEQANLDHALYYKDIFQSIDDSITANILDTILMDEVIHIKRGLIYTNSLINEQKKSLWDFYLENLPENLSPARGKGIIFNQQQREESKLSNDFILNMKNYQSDFPITRRKQWS